MPAKHDPHPGMRLSTTAHVSRPWRIHDLARDIHVEIPCHVIDTTESSENDLLFTDRDWGRPCGFEDPPPRACAPPRHLRTASRSSVPTAWGANMARDVVAGVPPAKRCAARDLRLRGYAGHDAARPASTPRRS